jgi:1,2-dihydroxy-3-keto-5-methylthiopentene dioxygenase
MSVLTIYDDTDASVQGTYHDVAAIAGRLADIGVTFERWQAEQPVADDASHEQVIAAYQGAIDRLSRAYAFQSIDVVALHPEHPDRAALREKFLDEHTHADFEVRFFVDGRGLFYIHKAGKIYAVLCERGDLISVPGDTAHWFDMGERPRFKAIRLFTTPDGWVASFTGSDLARRFPDFDRFVAEYA